MTGQDQSQAPTTSRGLDLVLSLYPKSFRARFADDFKRTFEKELQHAETPWQRGTLWSLTVVDALLHGTAMRLRPRSAQSQAAEDQHLSSARPLARFFAESIKDSRFAARLLQRSPLFAVTAALSLALGLAATAVIFNLGDTLLFQPSPGVEDAQRIVSVMRTTEGSGYDTLSYPMYEYLSDNATSFDAIAATSTEPAALSLSIESGAYQVQGLRVYGAPVSADYFRVLGVSPSAGRFFLPDEDEVPGERPVTVLSHSFWTSQLGADPNILGATLRLNRTEFQVIGIAEERFNGASLIGADLWIPMAMIATARGPGAQELLDNPRAMWLTAVGRLQPGVERNRAEAELATLLNGFRVLEPDFPEVYGVVLTSSGRLPPGFRLPFAAFMGLLITLTLGLLAIAGSNVAGMLLARNSARGRELATRLAIGASRAQLRRQLLIENLILFMLATLAALPLALWINVLLGRLTPTLPGAVQLDLSLDVRTVLFVLVLSVGSGLVFGMAPSRLALTTMLQGALGEGRSVTAGRERLRLRHGLVTLQVGLSLALVIVSGLFVRTLQAAADIDPGFVTNDVAIVSLDAATVNATGPEITRLADRLVEAVRDTPGVTQAAYARMIPLQGSSYGLGGPHVPGLDEATQTRLDGANWDLVSPNYFRTVGLTLVEGRDFADTDRDGQPLVAVVNETFARLAWPDETALGKRFWLPRDGNVKGREIEIIGVTEDAKYRSLSESSRPFIYASFAQFPTSRVEIYARHRAGPTPGNELRATISAIDPELPIVQLQSFEEAISLGLLPQRLAAWIAGCVGLLGVFLAMLGLYGLTAFLVAQRRREIAIRLALGASPGSVRSIVLRQTAKLGLGGALIGTALALALGMLVERLSLLVNVPVADPATFATVLSLMALVLAIASYQPTRRASATDPATTLRSD